MDWIGYNFFFNRNTQTYTHAHAYIEHMFNMMMMINVNVFIHACPSMFLMCVFFFLWLCSGSMGNDCFPLCHAMRLKALCTIFLIFFSGIVHKKKLMFIWFLYIEIDLLCVCIAVQKSLTQWHLWWFFFLLVNIFFYK